MHPDAGAGAWGDLSLSPPRPGPLAALVNRAPPRSCLPGCCRRRHGVMRAQARG